MVQFLVDIRNDTDENAKDAAIAYDGAGAATQVFATNHNGEYALRLSAPLEGVRAITLEGYAIVAAANTGVPRQPYLLVRFNDLAMVDPTLKTLYYDRVGGTGAVRNVEPLPSAPLLVTATPYCAHHFTRPRAWVCAGSSDGVTMNTLRLRVSGPQGEAADFQRLVLLMRVHTDYDTPSARSGIPALERGIGVEDPAAYLAGGMF